MAMSAMHASGRRINDILRAGYDYAQFIATCKGTCASAPLEGLTLVNWADAAPGSRETARRTLSYVPSMHASELTAPLRALAAYGALAKRVANLVTSEDDLALVECAAECTLDTIAELDPAMWTVFIDCVQAT